MHDEQTLQPAAADYWTTLEQYDRSAEYLEQLGEEFYPGAKPERHFELEGEEELVPAMQRRTFLKLGGFAALAAAIQGCERPVEHVLPYVNKPEEVMYGVANYYASTCTECAARCGLLVKTREGRPVKLEGNPEHPVNRGSLCTRGQASIMSLYDPDRLKFPVRVGRKANAVADATVTIAALDKEIAEKVAGARGKVVLLTGTQTGPATERLLGAFLSAGQNHQHVIYDAAQPGDERRAFQAAFGREVTPRYLWHKADVVVCLGADPLVESASPTETQKDFAAGRRPKATGMSRVYSFEPTPTLTGMSADYRVMVRPEHLVKIGLAIANHLILVQKKTKYANNADVAALLAPHTADAVAKEAGLDAQQIVRVAESLAASPGRSIITTTGAAARTENAQSLHLLGLFLNEALGNFSTTIDVTNSPSKQALGSEEAITRLIAEMKAGEVSVLIVSGVNPAYTLPASAGFAEAVKRVDYVVSLGLRMDETTALADVAIPGVHGLESWGDAEPQVGLYSLQQPVIVKIFGEAAADPTYDTRSWQESLMALLTGVGSKAFQRPATEAEIQALMAQAGVTELSKLDPTLVKPRQISWRDFIKETWKTEVYGKSAFAASDFEAFWTGAVRAGVIDTVGAERREGGFGAPAEFAALSSITPGATPKGSVSFVAVPTVAHGDGNSMTNPFLLELPDPVSKVSWDNYASLAPALAESLGIESGDHVRITVGTESIEVPAWIQPGTHKDVVAVGLGWGRNTFGGIGDAVGVAVGSVLGSTSQGAAVLSGLAAKLEKADGFTRLANTQGHNYVYSPEYAGLNVNKRKGDKIPENAERSEDGTPVYARPIIGETTLAEWQKDPYHGYPNHVEHGERLPSIWERSHKYVGHHWGLAVDLNACNGCGACVIACNIENNVPVVGKTEVLKGREMFWIRIDRYYRGPKDNPDFVHQPLMCQHCEYAPCETVCPVIATMHNDEGLNVMTYNRCVGTRYCANNCPYKVRRFNFWQYTDYRTGPYENVKRVSPLELVLNPDVTTRTRGVMEKCSFCNTRIRAAKEQAREAGRPLQDGEMKTACQQTCPAQAIIFGDRNDQNAEINKRWLDPRSYGLLADLNTEPSVRYLALVRNRDEATPYRTKYQAHRVDHHGHSHGDHGHGHGAAKKAGAAASGTTEHGH